MNEDKKYTWSVRIQTRNPSYIYYFGDFNSNLEAEKYRDKYIRYLTEKNIEIVNTRIKQNQPEKLIVLLK